MTTSRLFITTALLLSTGAAFAQTGDIYAGAAFQYNDVQQTGTARFRALGGNHAALGGDASSVFGNPAGLAFYNRSELSISPTFLNNSAQSTYLGNTRTDINSKASIGQLGLILAGDNGNSNRRWKRTALGVTYNQNINFSNRFAFEGLNRRSSFVNGIINDANSRNNLTGGQIDGAYTPGTNQAADLLAAAYQLYLVNGTAFVNGQNQEDSRAPFFGYDMNRARNQINTFESSGSQSQWTFAYAGNLDDKLYIGANVGLNRLRYNSDNVLTEQIQGGASFGSTILRDRLNVTGNGINVSLGAIYKLSPQLQIGATLASPTFLRVAETFSQNIRVTTVDPKLSALLTTDNVDVDPNDFEYRVTGPLRASGGATVFLGSGGKIGFLTASAEYVGYAGMRVNTTAYDAQTNNDVRSEVRTAVQNTYQNVINFRAGAEIRAGQFRIRGGAAYLPDAYIDKLDNIDRTRLLLSGGLGYRNARFFADVAGTYNTFKSAFTPYTLPNQNDYGSAQINNNRTNITLSVGTFF
ncbi:MAG: hypothetical protein EAZ91_23470 [Cytophagales bacterium]|nr:MAG: hypothetical protein EAZ91_23470 [Cytophagales bacterium]